MNFQKVLSHPDRDQIISRLTCGESVRVVADWLKEKYPTQKVNHICYMSLDKFRREYLNIHGTVLEDIKQKILEQRKIELQQDSRAIIKQNKLYNEKIDELVTTQVDWRRKLNQFLLAVETRFSQLFDLTQNNPSSYKPDMVMINWMKSMLDLIREIRKVEGAPDQVIQHNVAIQTIDEQVSILQRAIINTLSELDFETASMIIDKLNNNIQALKLERETDLLYTSENMQKIETIMAKFTEPEETKKDEASK